ncbi:MAG: hypothetical protein BGO90_13500 [Legionella sp. 40-6]|nr:hypothetical protein [Legionella sp.]OJX94598.1 MAG: hypothetical protein BGO90_13500 [Legionella sp. 40-6]
MAPLTLALLCTAALGVLLIIAAFIRQMILNREKKKNDEAQIKSLEFEIGRLDELRKEMKQNPRDAYQTIHETNNKEIKELDEEIRQIYLKKEKLLEEDVKSIELEANILTDGENTVERKERFKLKREVSKEKLASYDEEIKLLKERREKLLSANIEHERELLKQEDTHMQKLDDLYHQHSDVYKEVYLRHIGNSENIALETLKAGTSTFFDALKTPLQMLVQLFTGVPVTSISLNQTRVHTNPTQLAPDSATNVNKYPLQRHSLFRPQPPVVNNKSPSTSLDEAQEGQPAMVSIP